MCQCAQQRAFQSTTFTVDSSCRLWRVTVCVADPVAVGEAVVRNAVAWADAGAAIIGGCCRVTPEDIGGIAAALAR